VVHYSLIIICSETLAETGTPPIHVSHRLPSIIAPSPKEGRRKCCVCGKNVAGPDRQNHMGAHIFLAQRGLQESQVITPVNIFPMSSYTLTNIILGVSDLSLRVLWKDDI
jgi:hypothetical protein